MSIETYVCTKQEDNPHMGVMCYSGDHSIFFFDKQGWIKVGDVVTCERTLNGFYGKVWVNNELKTINFNGQTK